MIESKACPSWLEQTKDCAELKGILKFVITNFKMPIDFFRMSLYTVIIML